MSTQITSDSSLSFRLLPLSESGADSASGDATVQTPAVIGLSSAGPLPKLPDDASPAVATVAPGDANAGQAAPRMFWLEGDALMCACPDCRAPMSVRLWLMVADCWRCRTSIELTEEQEREALRLLKQREAAQRPGTPGMGAERGRTDGRLPGIWRPPVNQVARSGDRPVAQPRGAASAAARVAGSPSSPAPTPAEQPATASAKRLEATYNEPRRRLARHLTPGAWLLRLLKDSPAWLTSLLIHLIVLMILALLTPPREDNANYIRLNAIVSTNLRRPGQEEIANPADEVQFDLPVPDKTDLQDRQTRETVIRADQEARELRLVDTADPNLPDLERLKLEIGRADGSSVAIAARDPRVRVELIKQEGGTTLTEAAVARGLRWLAQQQQPDGAGGWTAACAATRPPRRWLCCPTWAPAKRTCPGGTRRPSRAACAGWSATRSRTATCEPIRRATPECTPTAKGRSFWAKPS